MSLISITGSYEMSLGITPCIIFINTSDSLATVMATGYLNGKSVSPYIGISDPSPLANNQMALVICSGITPVWLAVQIDSESNINLVAPTAV